MLQVIIFSSFPALTVDVTVKCIKKVENQKASELFEKCTWKLGDCPDDEE